MKMIFWCSVLEVFALYETSESIDLTAYVGAGILIILALYAAALRSID